MWIAPNGKVLILSGVPVDNSYTDVPWFESKGAQSSYFQGFLLSGQSYSKVGFMRTNTKLPATSQGNTSTPRDECTIRVPTNASNLYTANYLMFQNTAYSDKWFYAFVKRVNPLSDNVTEIEYELDEIQTWMFDFEIGACMVEREHIIKADDKIGANTVAEPFDCEKIPALRTEYLQPTTVALLCTTNPAGTAEPDEVFNRGGFTPNIGFILGADAVETALSTFVESKNLSGVITKCCYSPIGAPISITIENSFMSFPRTTQHYGYDDVKNKKLFTKQFYSIYFLGSDGSSKAYDVEGFGSSSPSFHVDVGGYPWEWVITPSHYYLSSLELIEGGRMHRLGINTMTSVPFGGTSWSTDMTTVALTGIMDVIRGAITGASMGGGAGAGLGALGGYATTVKNVVKASINPQRSTAIGGDLNSILHAALAENKCGFLLGCKAITADEAKSIDEYFTYYGYATDEYKVPNGLYSNKRSVFNYVKTADCMFKSCKCPVESAQKIKECFNNGIRLWHDTSKIGTKVEDND